MADTIRIIGDIDRILWVSVNAHGGSRLSLDRLVTLLQTDAAPDAALGPLVTFFTELPVPLIQQWAARHGLSRQQLARYYERWMVPLAVRHPALEAWFYGPDA